MDLSFTQDPSSTRSAWYTPPTSGSPSHLQPHPPPRPPSSSSSVSTSSSLHSSRNHSRSRHRSSRSSHRTIAAQFTQPGQQSSSDKPTTDSVHVTTSSLMTSLNGIGLAESKSRLSLAGKSGDVSKTSSGVGSSLSSSDYLYQSGTGGAVLDHSSSSATRNSYNSTSSSSSSNHRLARQQPDSLPRVGTVSDRNSLLSTQSSGHTITSSALSHPKPLFDAGMSSLDRYDIYMSGGGILTPCPQAPFSVFQCCMLIKDQGSLE